MKKEKRIIKDAKVLRAFIGIYCKKNHIEKGSSQFQDSLCSECYELLTYALIRNEKCPLDPKPLCKDCPSHCYRTEYRQRIRNVMKFSGIYFIKRGRIDWLWHYLF